MKLAAAADKGSFLRVNLNRGAAARAIALIGKQSAVLDKRQDFDEALQEQMKRVAQTPGLVSPSWTMYRFEANEVEFWLGDEDRKHIRLRYRLDGGKWVKNLLWA
ncbi:FMN-binding protein [Paenibacillus dendritiformis]|uniref:pyridoxine 5'-phosphate oxidase C-terminal domain-containing protein n=1 Tax=Paenibacillus dendritiformis TaxID=130049 RepID=UPI0010D596C8|nr:FMN-binding protein [Paenibacillus dendritiformis]